MKTHLFRGSKKEIAEHIVRISGEVREAIVFEEEPVPSAAGNSEAADIFAEMRPFMVEVHDFDDSREAIYSALVGE